MSDITPLTVPVFDLQSCDWLAPYCRETYVVYNKHPVRHGRDVWYRWGITSVAFHPDIVRLFIFFLGARVAEDGFCKVNTDDVQGLSLTAPAMKSSTVCV